MLETFVIFVAMFMLKPSSGIKLHAYPRLEAAGHRDRVLVIAPHIDDEAIGAAGYAIDALANGAEVYVAFVTAGDCNVLTARLMHKTLDPTALNYLSVGRTRIAEAKQAMKLLGVAPDHFFILGYPDKGLRTILDNPRTIVRSTGTRAGAVPYDDALSPGSHYNLGSLLTDLKRVIIDANPTVVIAPVPFDRHPDHSATAEIVEVALEELQLNPTRLGYLIHSSRAPVLVNTPGRALLPPRKLKEFAWVTYPLSPEVQELKSNVVMTYKSQRPYVFLLRNKFVRKNELFFVYPRTIAESIAPARVLLAR